MEAKGGTAAVTGELMTSQVRRIHVIYFLSRMGRIEHPHLIRVHHLSRNGVYLRDVKRWLSDLRGKDMPDSFSWSYKRKYKAGYVWQDLVDEDLITPISDNEYVLKGSEISSIPLDICSCGGKKASTEKPEPVEDKLQQPLSEKIPENPYKTSEIEIEIDEESSEPLESETSTVTDDSMKSNANKQKKPEKEENNSEKKNKKSTEKPEKTKPPLTSSATFTKSKSYSSGASQVFRNLLTCGAVDTNDSAMMIINRVQRSCKNPASEDSACNQQPDQQNSRKSFSGMKTSKNTTEKKVSAASKPVAEPICSQCGKAFNPEKLHSHMKSCKGMKSLGKTGGAGGGAASMAPEKISSWRSTDASSKELSTYFLPNFGPKFC